MVLLVCSLVGSLSLVVTVASFAVEGVDISDVGVTLVLEADADTDADAEKEGEAITG